MLHEGRATKATVPPVVKKKLEIEALLRWTFKDELPKDRDCGPEAAMGFGHAWNSVAAYGELLAKIDDGHVNRWGVVPFGPSVRGEPHPDALVVARAVADLEHLTLDLPEEWTPLEDLGAMGGLKARIISDALHRISGVDGDGARRIKLSLRRLVMRHAMIGGCPVTEADAPEVKVVMGANGKPRWFVDRRVEVASDPFGHPIYALATFDGFDAKRRRPYPEAYQKTYLDPDPTDACVARAEYELWRSALDVLCDDLAGAMAGHEALRSSRPMRPWEEAPVPAPVIWPDLTAPRVARCVVVTGGRMMEVK